jgi:Flp pilus assembly protein TadG
VRILRVLRSDEGASAVMFAAVAVVLLSMVAIVLDAGTLYTARRGMQTAADAAALAGVRELPGSPGAARAVANSYAQTNRPGLPVTEVFVESTYGLNDTVRVRVADPAVKLGMARFLGVYTAGADASAVAIVSSPTAYARGVMPFGIMSAETSATTPFGYQFYEPVLLKVASDEGSQGNFHFIALTDPPSTTGTGGANTIKDQLSGGGTSFPVYVGAEYSTRPGINGIKTSDLLEDLVGSDAHGFFDVVSPPDESGVASIKDPDCPRLLICPIVVNADTGLGNWTAIKGASSPVRVVGFAWLFLESWGGSGNDSWVRGRFIRPFTSEEVLNWGPIDPLGAVGYRLTD